MSQQHADIVVTTLEHLATASEDKAFARSRSLIHHYGSRLRQAMLTAAIYSMKGDGDDIFNSFEPSKWADLRDQFRAGTQAVFNHGDSGPEQSVALVFTTHDQESNTTADSLVLWTIEDGHVVGFYSQVIRGVPVITYWPIFDMEIEGRVGLREWALYEGEADELQTTLYVAGLTYLNTQIEVSRVSGGDYGDGLRSLGFLVV